MQIHTPDILLFYNQLMYLNKHIQSIPVHAERYVQQKETDYDCGETQGKITKS